ncbi:uncharacterized protein GO595_009811 [Histomonas meleagridis]|uniref:uncharacterized protein n=1 Tax=Histomonas meleagridis TaxID=135588 RepID=UPI003559AA2C|nr:hypothetical protein GO595_009811 [Histomonas meleagridis]
MWLSGKINFKENESLLNKYFQKSIIALVAELQAGKDISLTRLANYLAYFIYTPPFKFEEKIWVFLIKMLPLLSNYTSPAKNDLHELSYYAFLSSGIQDPVSLKLILKLPIDHCWEDFVGHLLSFGLFLRSVSNKLFETGIWTKNNPFNKRHADLLLSCILKRDLTQDIRSHCFFGLCRVLLHSYIGIFDFRISVDSLLSSFGSSIFPLDHILPERYIEIFDLFGVGSLETNSKWLKIFSGSIRKELHKNRPASTTNIIRYISRIIYSRPTFSLSFAGDCITAVHETNDIDFTSKDIALLCCSLAEVMNNTSVEVEGKKEFFKMIYSQMIKNCTDLYTKLFITLITKIGSLNPIMLDLILSEFSPETILLTGFSSHFYQSVTTDSMLSSLIDKIPNELKNYLTLAIVEVLGNNEMIRKDSYIMIKINEFAQKLERDSIYKKLLLNMISVPNQYQMNINEIKDILNGQKDFYQLNSSIISSNFIDNDNAVFVFRNLFTISVFKLSPITNNNNNENIESSDDNNKEDVKPPFAASKNNPFYQYKYNQNNLRKKDTFYLLASLGLFSEANEHNIYPLDEKATKKVKEFELNIGKKQFDIILTRVKSKSKNLFDAKKPSNSFNKFTKKLGNFLITAKTKNGIVPIYNVPFYDTALFRFVYFSKYHFDKKNVDDFMNDKKNSFALIIFNDSKSELRRDNEEYKKFKVVIEVSLVIGDLYSISVLRFDNEVKVPFIGEKPRLISSENLANEIAFVLYVYVSSNIETLYFNDLENFIQSNKLFTAEPKVDGIDLLAKVVGGKHTNEE